jgi:hypothetical protein
VEVVRPKVRDRGATGADRIRFTSAIPPLWARRTKSLDVLLPILYLRGISTGDFREALSALLGKDAPNLSPSVISGLKAQWQGEYERWQQRDLSARHYVYVWADGVFLQARMEDSECMLVLIGATPEGKKELIGFQVGVRESAQSWRELLIDIRRRGLQIAPELAVGDGALGFWKALDEVFPGTRRQRCWQHKTVNVLNKVPSSVQSGMKKALQDISMAPSRAVAELALRLRREIRCQIYARRGLLEQGSRRSAGVLCLPCRALGPLADHQSDRERVRHGAAQDSADQGIVVAAHRQADGVQTDRCGVQNLAATKRHKSVAEIIAGVRFADGIEVVPTQQSHAA